MADDLAAEIARSGPMPFDVFMKTALYDPQRGYYGRGPRQVGREGDFFTSVSVGPVFGTLLARRFLRWWRGAGCPERWRLTEVGAHDGTLAADIMDALATLSLEAFSSLEYRTIEPLPALAEAQRRTLARFGSRAEVSPVPTGKDPLPGIVFGNELLDALPFQVIEWRDGGWRECRVAAGQEGFEWVAGPAVPGAPLPPLPLVDGYRTEFRPGLRGFLEPFAAVLRHGLFLWIDYGFPRASYLSPGRSSGTLRTFSRHRAGEDPLSAPGEMDITAHVDFTAVAEAAMDFGGVPAEFSDQGSWLTRLAADWLTDEAAPPSAPALRQFQTLVHPAHLGARFNVLEIAVRDPVPEEARERTLRRLGLPADGEKHWCAPQR